MRFLYYKGMAKSAFNKDVFRSITHSMGRFIAVFAIVALGVGFYAGIRMAAPDMRLAADAFYDETNLMDIRVVSTMGLDEADIEELRRLDGVADVMAAYETDVVAEIDDEPYAMRVHSLPYSCADQQDGNALDGWDESAQINQLVLEEGRWPDADDECILSVDRIMNKPLSLGDTLVVAECSTGLDDTLQEKEYTVVGLAHSSYYASSTSMGSTTLGSGLIQQFMFVPQSDFKPDFPITEAFITVRGAKDLLSGSEAYQARIDEVMDEIASIEAVQEQARLRTIKNEAQGELDEAREEFEKERDDAYAKLDEARIKLDEAAAEIASSQKRIADGERSYESGRAELASQRADAEQQLADASARIEAERDKLVAGKAELDEQGARLEAAWSQIAPLATPATAPAVLAHLKQQLAALPSTAPEEERRALEENIALLSSLIEGQTAYDAGISRYEEGVRAIDAAESELEARRADADAQMADAARKLDQAAAELAHGREQLASGEREYESGRAEYESERARAESEIADAQAKIDQAQADIDAVEMPEWLIMDRTKNYGAESFDMDAGRVDNIAMVFPFVFFLVAALVALTTMTRMVDEERIQIGTYKALGYARLRIISKYLIYAGSASLLGSIVGIALLSFTLPFIIMTAYSIVYIVPISSLALDWPIALLATALGVGITLFATVGAALSTLRESPAALMQPKTPKAGKKILLELIRPIWTRLSFLWKVTCRNIFRYKKRLFMTIIGIAGCTALLLTGFGLQDSINDIIDKHYGELIDYNMIVVCEEDADEGEVEDVEQAIRNNDKVVDVAAAYEKPMVAQGSEGDLSVELIVPEDPESFSHVWLFRERIGHAPVALTSDGALITEKISTRYGIHEGDEIALAMQDDMGNATNEVYRLPVSGVIENYIGHDVFIDAALYERVFHASPRYDDLFIQLDAPDDERDLFAQNLREIDAVKTVSFNDETIDMYKTALRSVNMVVVVLIVAAALLAFIVLYNLTNINITERRREIATLKVLGFTAKEIDQYIFREILILACLGAVLGLVFGVFLENFVVTTAEVDAVMFGRDIHWPSFVYSFLLTMLFTIIVAISMRGKLKQVDMVSSLKSNE